MVITENIKNDFRIILGLKEGEAVPDTALAAYASYVRMNDLAGSGPVQPKELMLIALISGAAPEVAVESLANQKATAPSGEPDETDTENDTSETVTFKKGDRITALYEGERRAGAFVSLCGGSEAGNCRVKLDDDTARFREVALAVVTAA